LSSHAAVDLRHHFENREQQKDASTLGMWVFLVTEIMFFGGLFLAYIAYRTAYPEAFGAASNSLNIPLGALNTGVLICSSLTMAMAVHSAAIGKKNLLIMFLIATLVLGGVFLGVKAVEYHDKWVEHHVPGPNFHFVSEDSKHPVDSHNASLYFALYFAMTGLHATHMIIGGVIILVLIRMAQKNRFTPEWHTPVELFGLYWHFVDIVWIFLFPLLYLIDPKNLGK
jgi:cytochrome c oxidase subunit 3